MNRFFLFSLFVSLSVGLISCGGNSNEKHLGTWYQVGQNNDTSRIILDQENYYTLMVGGTELLGKGIRHQGGKSIDTKFEIDYTTTPISFDLFEVEGEKKNILSKGILDFPDDNSLRLKLTSGNGERPAAFPADDPDASVFTREK